MLSWQCLLSEVVENFQSNQILAPVPTLICFFSHFTISIKKKSGNTFNTWSGKLQSQISQFIRYIFYFPPFCRHCCCLTLYFNINLSSRFQSGIDNFIFSRQALPFNMALFFYIEILQSCKDLYHFYFQNPTSFILFLVLKSSHLSYGSMMNHCQVLKCVFIMT